MITWVFMNAVNGDVYITQLPFSEAWKNALSADPDKTHWTLDIMDDDYKRALKEVL